MCRKWIIFEKWNPTFALAKNGHFPVHFYFHFRTSFQAPLQHPSIIATTLSMTPTITMALS
jgi:hypothetical protein